MDNVFGSFNATKINWLKGNVQYLLIFCKNELIAAKIGGQFDEKNAISSIGLVLGGTAGALAAGKTAEGMEKQKSAQAKIILSRSKEEILSLDKKNNFCIPYSGIDSAELKKSRAGINGARAGAIKILGKRNISFDIQVGEDFESAKATVRRALQQKLKE